MSDHASGLSMIEEPTEDLEIKDIKVPHDLTPSEADLYRLLTSKGYRVLRHGWPDFWVVPSDGTAGFAVEVKSGSSQVRPDQKKMHEALEVAGVKVLVVKESTACELELPAPPRSLKAAAGRIGGASTSPAKAAAAKVNGARGGRPWKAATQAGSVET